MWWVCIVLPRVSVNIGCWGDGLGELVGVSFDRCFETVTGSPPVILVRGRRGHCSRKVNQ